MKTLTLIPTDHNLPDNTFAAACLDNSIAELLDAFTQKAADKTDCDTWKITPTEWRNQIRLALEFKLFDRASKMTDAEFQTNMHESDFIQKISEPEDASFWKGYQRGLRRAKIGEDFGTDAEHAQFLSLADNKHNELHRYQGLGYRAGLQGLTVAEGVKLLKEITVAAAFSASQSKKGAVMSDARREALAANQKKPRPGAKGKPKPRLAKKNAIVSVCVTSRVALTTLGPDATKAQALAFCSLAEPAMAQAVFALFPTAAQVEVDIFPTQDGIEEGIGCSALNAEQLPVYAEEEKLAQEMARVFAEVLAAGEWK